ncbi:DUF4237 domain-containing protein [Microbacterium protaetiae]|uniref:DUF4237 domain-containing protein n=1 Tax=Microbacterium protaetiae TaxID=2509458 RepID=A0A4P6EG19_9MICO|nr:TNT domain-containing protein [Microbacterium protaetiae]QAY60099.1 DUF4237 domain-containing protein [Microbacterium protaetiae]
MHTRDPSGNGWTRAADDPVTPKDLGYGQPMHDHGTSDPYPDANQMDPDTGNLRADPGAPYGRFDDGTPLSKQDYDDRYVFGNGHDNYPPNAGAVRGSRVHYDDWDAFQRDYGTEMDRIGHPGGSYIGVKEDGVSPSFEQRSLPTSSLQKEFHNYQTGGSLPGGWKVEASEIAPGFGHQGGGIQLRVLDASGNPVNVATLLKMGLLS